MRRYILYLCILFIVTLIGGLIESRTYYHDRFGNIITFWKPSLSNFYYVYPYKYCDLIPQNGNYFRISTDAEIRLVLTDSTIVIWTETINQIEISKSSYKLPVIVYSGYDELNLFNKKYFLPNNFIFEWSQYCEYPPQFWNKDKWNSCKSQSVFFPISIR